MKRLLSIAAAAALAVSPAFAQNGPVAGSVGGGIAQNVVDVGPTVPVEVVLGGAALVVILLVAGSGGSDSTTSTPSSPPS
jgi:hypothetical protein